MPLKLLIWANTGEVESIDPSIVSTLDDGNFIPVIAPIGVGKNNFSYNINADLVASTLASVLQAEKLILLTNTQGCVGSVWQVINRL